MAQRGFSLIELTIVLAIVIVLGAITVPRFSRGVEGAGSSALVGDLAVLNRAVDLFAAEHGGRFPDGGRFPNGGRFSNESRVAVQLTRFTDEAGDVSMERTVEHIYGPYLRSVPPLPVGPNRGSTGIGIAAGPGIGWIYDAGTGRFTPNVP